MNADDTGAQRLTTQSAAYRALQLSPDGTKLAYDSDQSGCRNVWVMNIDGSNATQLTSLNGLERCNEVPRWSPDGTKIAFQSSRNPDLGWDVYVMNADGTGVVNASNDSSTDLSSNNEMITGWSPDGRVVFSNNRTGTYQSYIVNADGSGFQPLFNDTFELARWSPDQSKIVAVKDWDVYVMNTDGTGLLNLSDDPAFDSYGLADPWSPDGSRIAFRSMRTGEGDIFVVNADGTGLTNVTDAPGDDAFPAWSPDGSKLLLASNRDGDWEIYVQNADGSDPVNVSNDPTADDQGAIWVPKR